ncbi:MAG: hypothetical protein WCP86_10490, partial [bacterium]
MGWFSKSAESSVTEPTASQNITAVVERAIQQARGEVQGPIQPNALLGADLGLSSIAVARLAGILRKDCGGRPLPLHKLLVKPDGTLLQDIRVSDLVAFLGQHM